MNRALLALCLLAPAAACNGAPQTSITGRVWLSKTPRGPKDPFSAFVLASAGPGPAAGVFHHGSAYAGTYRAVTFRATGSGEGLLTILQTGKTRTFRFRPCRPDRGYDRCIEVTGDPFGTRRYQSKDRWRIPGRSRPAGALQAAIAEAAGTAPAVPTAGP